MLELITPCLILILPGGQSGPQVVSRDHHFAIRLSKMAAKKNYDALKSTAQTSSDPIERLISAYLLYKVDPNSNSDLFTRSFPATRAGVSRFLKLYSSIPYSSAEEDQQYRYPNSKWSIGFWPIYHAYLERVKAGDPIALKRFLQLEGHGDGEVGEGIAQDIGDLFQSPKFALDHWQTLNPYMGYLRSIKNWVSDEAFINIRRQYSEALPTTDPKRAKILELLDTPE